MKFKAIFAALLAVSIMKPVVHAEGAITPASKQHNGNTGYNWYCKNNDEHRPPELPSEFSFINENGGYYLDKNVKDGDKVIYLTFDAGYENGNVEKILDAMKKHNAKGAFFVLSNLIERNTDLVKRMLDEGHLVCNHTSMHRDMTKCTDCEKFRAELDSLNAVMNEYCGCGLAPFYRPPEGRFSENNLKWAQECGYKTVFWSYAYADWDNNKQMSCDRALEKIMSHIHNGEVILLHPTSSTNAAILDELLCRLEKEGYRFGTLYELTSENS